MTSGYLEEVYQQPETLRRAVGEFMAHSERDLDQVSELIRSGGFDNIVLTGMGASLHSCYPLYLMLTNSVSTPSMVWDASELVHFAPDLIGAGTLLIAVSQSGESAELTRLTELKRRPGMAISVTNGDNNTLAHWADIPLYTRAGAEATVSNKTYTAGLTVLHLLGSSLSGRNLARAQDAVLNVAQRLERSLASAEEQANRIAQCLSDAHCLAFIGRGFGLASARAASLIVQEASKVPCAAYSGGEFRHGPLELAGVGFRAVIFVGSGGAAVLNRRLAKEICDFGGQVLLVSSSAADDLDLEISTISIPTVEPALSPILEIVPVQFLTIPLARTRGYEPATFVHARKVTTTE